MALNLLRAAYRLAVFDVSPAPLTVLREAGASVMESAADAVRDADVVISMLPTSGHVKDLYLGEYHLLSEVKPNALIIDCSTIAPQVAQEVARAAAVRGNIMIDAPVSGGTAAAAAGTLTFIVGGDVGAVDKARPLLKKMGNSVLRAGSNGSGQIAKICNNMLSGIQMIGTCEALALGVANGVDPKVLSEIISKSSGRNWAVEAYNPWPGVMDNVPAGRSYRGGFASDLMLKDLGLAQEAALSAHCATPLGALARQLYQLHSQSGCGVLDFSSIVCMFRRLHATDLPS